MTAILLAFLASLLAGLLKSEIEGWSPKLSRWITNLAAQLAPARYRNRLREEWQSALLDVPGILGPILFAVGFLFAASLLRASSIRRPRRAEVGGALAVSVGCAWLVLGHPAVWIWPLALLVTCSLAVLCGHDEERLAAGTLLAGWALTVALFRWSFGLAGEVFLIAVEVAILGVFVRLAIRSVRLSTCFAAAFQLLSVATLVLRATSSTANGWAYSAADLIWSYLLLITVAYSALTASKVSRDLSESEPK